MLLADVTTGSLFDLYATIVAKREGRGFPRHRPSRRKFMVPVDESCRTQYLRNGCQVLRAPAPIAQPEDVLDLPGALIC